MFLSGRGFEVERCDDCFGSEPDSLTDEDVATLPEAQHARRLASASEGLLVLLEADERLRGLLVTSVAADLPGAEVEFRAVPGEGVAVRLWSSGEPLHDEGLVAHVADLARRLAADRSAQ